MDVTITAVNPDNRGCVDPIIHHVTGASANIHEIQMCDHDPECLFTMLMRIEWPDDGQSLHVLRVHLAESGRIRGLGIDGAHMVARGTQPPATALNVHGVPRRHAGGGVRNDCHRMNCRQPGSDDPQSRALPRFGRATADGLALCQ